MNGWTSKAILILQQEGNQLLCPAGLSKPVSIAAGGQKSYFPPHRMHTSWGLPSDTWEPSKRKDIFLLPVWDQLCLSQNLGFFHYRPKRKESILVFSVDCSQIEWGNTGKIFLQLTNNLVNKPKPVVPWRRIWVYKEKYWKIIPLHPCLWVIPLFKNLRIKSN